MRDKFIAVAGLSVTDKFIAVAGVSVTDKSIAVAGLSVRGKSIAVAIVSVTDKTIVVAGLSVRDKSIEVAGLSVTDKSIVVCLITQSMVMLISNADITHPCLTYSAIKVVVKALYGGDNFLWDSVMPQKFPNTVSMNAI